LSVSAGLSGCAKDKEAGKNDSTAESAKEANDQVELDIEGDSQEDKDITQNVKDAMNDTLDQSDVELTEEERDAINEMFDMFAG
jgi:hypothetical protein